MLSLTPATKKTLLFMRAFNVPYKECENSQPWASTVAFFDLIVEFARFEVSKRSVK